MNQRKIDNRQDGNAKRQFRQKSLIATVLKYAVRPLGFLEPKDIIPLLEPQNEGKRMIGLSEERQPLEAGAIRMDTFFEVKGPNGDEEKSFFVNFEIQGNRTQYPLIKRGIYYLCGRIWDEKGTVFRKSDYGRIRSVFGLWVVLDPPVEARGTWNHYSFHETTVDGEYQENPDNYQLIELDVIHLGLNDPKAYNGNTLMEILSYLFEGNWTKQERIEKLKGYGIEFMEEDEDEMSNFDQILAYYKNKATQKGLEEGIEKGLAEGREKGLAEGRAEGRAEGETKGKSFVIKELRKSFDLKTISEMLHLPVAEIEALLV